MIKRTNEEWLHALKQPGDEQREALEDLREYLFRAVFVYLRDRRRDLADFAHSDLREMAQDFAQEAVMAVQDSLEKFRGDSKFTTWTYRFVINIAASELRRRRYGFLSFENLAEQEAEALMSLTEQHSSLDPDLAAERQDFLNLLLQIIHNELSDRQRQAIVAVHFQGHSIREVAEQLETTPNTLYKILHDARKKIKARLLAHHLGEGDILALFETRL